MLLQDTLKRDDMQPIFQNHQSHSVFSVLAVSNQQAAFIFVKNRSVPCDFRREEAQPNRFAAYTSRCDVPHATRGQLRLL